MSFLCILHVQNRDIFGVAKISIFLGGRSDIPDIFIEVNSRCIL